MMNLGIYIHIPFCVKKCKYCDFVSFSNFDFNNYFEALEKEIDLYSDFLKERKIDSVFIGGGTPSCVPHNYISKTLSKIDISSDCEITIETNPFIKVYFIFTTDFEDAYIKIQFGGQILIDGLFLFNQC